MSELSAIFAAVFKTSDAAPELLPDAQICTSVTEVGLNHNGTWPHTQAMSGAEIELFMQRVARFDGLHGNEQLAQVTADLLVQRDRQGDDRRLCVECSHCRAGLTCTNGKQAGHTKAYQHMGVKLATMLMRCDGFKDWHHGAKGKT